MGLIVKIFKLCTFSLYITIFMFNLFKIQNISALNQMLNWIFKVASDIRSSLLFKY